jgi:hypothetical protein
MKNALEKTKTLGFVRGADIAFDPNGRGVNPPKLPALRILA